MSAAARLDVASAVELLPTSVVYQLLVDLAEKDASLAVQLICLAISYRGDLNGQQLQETIEERPKSAQHRIQQLEREVKKLSNRDRRERRMLLLEDFVDTISTVRFAEACSGIILSSLEGASILQCEAQMERILAVDEWSELLESSTESAICQTAIEGALNIVKDCCSTLGQCTRLAEDYDGKFSTLVNTMFSKAFNGYIFEYFPSPTGIHRMDCPPVPYFRPYPGRTSPLSPAILLSFPAEITRLIFHLGAEELLPPLGMVRVHDRQISYRIRNAYLRNASLVHPLWRNQAQAELVTFAYCDEKEQLNGLVTFLEESKQGYVLRNISLEIDRDMDLSEAVILTEKEMLSFGYTPDKSGVAPLWYAAKRLLDLGVCLDRLEVLGLRPGPMTWSLLRQIPAETLYLAHSRFYKDDSPGFQSPLPHTTRLILDCACFYDEPASTTIFNNSCSITKLILYKPFLYIDEGGSINQIWTPLAETVTSLSSDLRFTIESLGLQELTGLSEIRVYHRKHPSLKLPVVEELCSTFPKLIKLVLPKESAWNSSESQLGFTGASRGLEITRRSTYSEKRGRHDESKTSKPWDWEPHRYFHDNGGDSDREEGSSARYYSTSDGYTSANSSLDVDDPGGESEYESEGESIQDLESLMETFVAFEGAEFRRTFSDEEGESAWESDLEV